MAEKSRGMGGVWGWRGILGYICPGVYGKDQYLQEEYHMIPEGVGFLVTTLGMVELSDGKETEKALLKVDEAARQLAEGGADFICLGSAPLRHTKGYGWDKELIKRLQEITKLPSATTETCCIDAFRALSIKKLVIATHHGGEEMNRRKKFLEDAGLEILNIKGLGISRLAEVRKLPMHVPYNLAKEAYLETPEADGIWLGCPAWGGPPVVEFLERDLGKPVVTAHQAFIWAGLKALNIKDSIKGYGRLLETV